MTLERYEAFLNPGTGEIRFTFKATAPDTYLVVKFLDLATTRLDLGSLAKELKVARKAPKDRGSPSAVSVLRAALGSEVL